MRRILWILLTPLIIFTSLWLLVSLFFAPQVEKWTLNKIASYSEESLPVKIRAKDIQLGILKPSLGLEGLEFETTEAIASSLKSLRLQSVRVYIDFLDLLSGRLTVSAVVLNSPEVEINLDPFLENDTPPGELPIDQLFAQLAKWPLERVLLKDVVVKLTSKKLGLEVYLSQADLLATNMGKNLTAKATIPNLSLKHDKLGDFHGSFDTHLYLTRQSLRIIQLGIHLNESELIARGELLDIRNLLLKPTGILDLSAQLNLSEVYEEVVRTRPNLKIPRFSGELHFEVDTRFNGLEDLVSKADIKTRALVVENFQLGDAKIQGEYKNKSINLSEIKVFHPAGEAVLTQSQMSLDGNYDFKTKINVKALDLQKLFRTIDLASIPVGMDLQGNLPCEGQIYPFFQFTCTQAELQAHDLWVKTENTAKTPYLVNVHHMGARGQVRITKEFVEYAATVSLGNSTGSSHGLIDFAKGFKIDFNTKDLDFKNVENLAHLKFEGSAGIDGSTSGDSNSAVFNMTVNARNFIFENFALGNLLTELRYKSGHLIFDDIAGAINRTNYLGELDVDLTHEKLKGSFRIPTAELQDVAQVFQRIYKFPLRIQGVGAAKAQVEGPLSFWKLNYKLESQFKKISLGSETFDLLTFDVSGKNGNISTDKVLLQKNSSTLKLEGGITSDKILNLYADGKNWRLEESDFLNASQTNSSIVGQLNFAAEFKESIQNPKILLKGAVSETLIEEQEIPNSDFILTADRSGLGLQLSLFGDKVQGDLQIPYEKGTTPLVVKVKTNNWNYSSLLGLVGGANLANEYTSALTSSVDLRSSNGDFFKTSGKIGIEKLILKRGNMSFNNPEPIEILSDNGVMAIKNFNLEGPESQLQIKGTNFTADNLNLSVNLAADLRLLQILTPFLEDLGGEVRLATTLSGPLKKPEILGNLQNKNAYVKIKGFPHPLEKLSTDVVFSQSKILINSIKAQIAGGTLTGDGGISINGIRDLPISLRLRLDNVSMNVPEKIRTNGNADLLISGHWFPFTLSGTYHVNNALVEKEFTEDSGEITGVKQSLYLPKFIRESNFEPLNLDLQIVLDENIFIKNSLLDGSVSGSLQVKGVPTFPLLFGKINVAKKTKLYFKDKIFEIQNGLIEFDDPAEINPNLYITALSRINDYDITLLTQGSSKNLAIRLTSVPPLSEQDIISLIALGITSAKMDQNLQSRQQAEQLGVEIGGAVLAKPISKQLESTLGLNLQVTSEYDSTGNISVPKITLSRRLSDRVKVSGSRPVRDTITYDLKMEYLINNNITAIGSFESRGIEDSTTLQTTQPASQSIFGLDLEFKREFK